MQTLGIRISKQKINGGTLTCRRVTVREKLLRLLLGPAIRLAKLPSTEEENAMSTMSELSALLDLQQITAVTMITTAVVQCILQI